MSLNDEGKILRQKLLGEGKVPDVFYKYYPIEAWLPNLLTGNSVRFSSRRTFNDPFDSRPAFQVVTDTHEGAVFIKDVLSKCVPNPAQRLQALQRIRNQSRKPRQFGESETEKMLDATGILCLATSWDNQLLWSHYANHHKGICIGFHSNIDIFKVVFPIDYVTTLPVIRRPGDSNDELLRKALLTKAMCWKYEDEWRIIKRALSDEQRAEGYAEDRRAGMHADDIRVLNDRRGATDYAFDKRAIHSITIGMRAPQEHVTMVLGAAKDAGLDVPIYRTAPPSITYEISRSVLKRARR